MRACPDLQALHYFACLGFQPQSCSAPDFCQGSAAGLLPSASTDAAGLDVLWTDAGRAWVSAAQQSSAHGEFQAGTPLLLDLASSARGLCLLAAGLMQTSSGLIVAKSEVQLLSRQATI